MNSAKTINNEIQSNPYLSSTLIQKAKKSLLQHGSVRLAFLDIDNTLTGSTSHDTNHAREKLENLNYAVCFVTARTEESMMSEKSYRKSRKLGFKRPHPKLETCEGRRIYIDPGKYEPRGLIDPDVIAGSTGTKIILRQDKGAYCEDFEYTEKLGVSSKRFREAVLRFISFVNFEHNICKISPIESEENYLKGVTNVFPSDFRVAVEFKTVEHKKNFAELLKVLKREKNHGQFIKRFLDIEILSEIKFSADGSDAPGRVRGYITPRKADKGAAAEQIIDTVAHSLAIERGQIETLFAGDAFPDLSMGLHAGRGTQAKFILVGGSRLSTYLTQKELWDFAGETLSVIKEKLFPTNKKGVYSYRGETHTREVIIADMAYANTFGPQSILQAFKEY